MPRPSATRPPRPSRSPSGRPSHRIEAAVFAESGSALKVCRVSSLDVAALDHELPDVADRDVSDVGVAAARIEWAGAAREMLLVAARKYQALVQHKDIAIGVQDRTGLRTK